MKMLKTLPVFLLMLVATACSSGSDSTKNRYNIIPLPQQLTPAEGVFKLNNKTQIGYPLDDKEFEHVVEMFIKRLETVSGMKLEAIGDPAGSQPENSILFKISDNEDELGAEGYTLTVVPDRILVEATTAQGAFYAVQTLYQLLPAEIVSSKQEKALWEIPCVEIKDWPQFVYRGMHLDVCRHFFTIEEVKQYIDLIAMHKMNIFHWHLTDDQGWRIEIKSHPKLTEVGSKRKETLIGSYYDEYPQVYDGKEYGGYFTQEEAKEVVAYAAEHFITVIPEIEMPGHASAALAAYPEYSCTGGPIEVETKWGVFKDIFCPKEETFAMLEDVITEIVEIFPGKYIHVGGDEAPKDRWKQCPHCQALIKKEKLKDEHGLQNYFITRMEKFINSKGRQIIGWDEILDGGIAPNATIMSWRGTKGGIAAAEQNHYAIMTPTAYCYLDYNQYDQYLEPLSFGGFNTLKNTYSFNPIPQELDKEKQKYILGVQGNMWNEYCPTFENLQSKAFPRFIALAETGWTENFRKDYYDFASRLAQHLKRLDILGINHSRTMFDVLALPEYDKENNKLFVSLESMYDPAGLRYTLDGTEPTYKSTAYAAPIEIKGRVALKAGLFENGKLLGRIFEREYVAHEALGAHIIMADSTDGSILVDGLRASIYDNPGWYPRPIKTTRSDGTDQSFVIDLKENQPISRITACMINQPLYRVVAPTGIAISFSENGETYSDPIEEAIANPEPRNRRNVLHTTETGNVNARYLKVTLKNAGYPFPDDPNAKPYSNAGKPAVIMLDEFIVE
ncbi:MAG: family 20 glycosylhydrolase [Prevotellaceae bacterium]|jgi:hexosaminidase|nr:family 20 glycosylhydrolase [Prevotellaceae bacterium]